MSTVLTHPLFLIHNDVKVTRALALAIKANGGKVIPETRFRRPLISGDTMAVELPAGTYRVYTDEYNYTLHLPDGQRIAGEFGGAHAVYLDKVPYLGEGDTSGWLTHGEAV